MNFVNSYKRGDLAWSAQFLRRILGEHTLFCRPEFADHLPAMLEGTQVSIRPLHEHPDDCIDLWIGSGSNAVNWYSEGCPRDLIAFLMKFFNSLEHGEIFTDRRHMLADYPALLLESKYNPPGILVINCDPQSGQALEYVPDEMTALVQRLKGLHDVVTVDGMRFSFSEIGQIAKEAKLIIGVATGPVWPCLSVHSSEVPKMLILDPIFLDYGCGVNIDHYRNVASLTAGLEKAGWL